jgi:EAL domain-containing protein (putative c-di-GMP-specific phosphodiesterase class I)
MLRDGLWKLSTVQVRHRAGRGQQGGPSSRPACVVDAVTVETVPVRSDGAALAATKREAIVQRVLAAARQHLGLEIAFVSQFIDGQRVFRYVDSDAGLSLVEVGGSDPVENSYCHYVALGALPGFLRDPAEHPVSARLPATAALGVGTHLSVPIRFSDGRVYGTFCSFGMQVRPDLQPRDLQTLEMLAGLVGDHLESLDADERDQAHRREQIFGVLADPLGITMVFQPLVELATEQIIAVEALARFPTLGDGPQSVFAHAWSVGLGGELEIKAVRAALSALDRLPDRWRLGVNVSPSTLVNDEFLGAVHTVPPGRLAVEVTEHDAVDDYDELRAARRRLRAVGIRLAIDDVGMGFSGLNHILESEPDTIKIDAAVVRDVDTSPAKAAMIQALVSFGDRMDILVVAEGIETANELAALRTLGITVGQGFHLARPDYLVAVIG